LKKYSKCSFEVLGVSLFEMDSWYARVMLGSVWLAILEARGSVSHGNATAVFRLYRKKIPTTAVGMRHVLDANVSSCILVHAA
jgi:hypothetical protein